jgi:hypothetical protein
VWNHKVGNRAGGIGGRVAQGCRAIGVARVGQPRQIEQDEAELERAPGMVIGCIKRVKGGRLTALHGGGVQRMHPLERHRAVRKAKRGSGLRVGIKQRNADANAVERLATASQRRPGRAQIWHEVGFRRRQALLLARDPIRVGGGERREMNGELAIGHLGECLHVDGQVGELLVAGIAGLRRGGLGQLIRRHDRGPDARGPIEDWCVLRVARPRHRPRRYGRPRTRPASDRA